MAATWAYLLVFCLQAAVSLCLFDCTHQNFCRIPMLFVHQSVRLLAVPTHTVLTWELQFVRLSHVWGLSTDRCSSAYWSFS